MPSVSALDDRMKLWSDDWSTARRFPNYFKAAWAAVEEYYQAATPSIRPMPNFEKVLGDLVGLAHWMTPSPFGNALRQLVAPAAWPPGLAFPSGDFGATVAINDQLSYLLMELARHMRKVSRGIENAPNFPTHQGVLNALRQSFDVGIFNLNYDTGVIAAWPDTFTGFDIDGTFSASAVHERREWGFAYHLHGSVHHSLVGIFGNSIRWQDDLTAEFFDGHQGLATDKRSDNRSFPKTTLIAGGFKLDQLLVEPFQSFYSSLVRCAYEADAILIGGYGFGDVHVNRALQNRLERNEPRPPVMVLTWPPHVDPMEFRADAWGHAVNISLHAPMGYAEPGHQAPPVIEDLVQRGGFEVSKYHRVAIWHGGYIEAAKRLDAVIPWLAATAGDSILAGR